MSSLKNRVGEGLRKKKKDAGVWRFRFKRYDTSRLPPGVPQSRPQQMKLFEEVVKHEGSWEWISSPPLAGKSIMDELNN